MTSKAFNSDILDKLRLSAIRFARRNHDCFKHNCPDITVLQNIEILTGYKYVENDLKNVKRLNSMLSMLEKAIINGKSQSNQKYGLYSRLIGLHQLLAIIKEKRLSILY